MGSIRMRNQITQAVTGKRSFQASLRVGVIYCTSKISAKGREMEMVANHEEAEVAQAVGQALEERGHQVELVDLDPVRMDDLTRFDHIFNLAETMYGFPLRDYEVAERLEELHIGFTGSGSMAIKACVNKAVTKKKLRKRDIPTPPFEVLDFGTYSNGRLAYPLFVKPVHEDGSIGIDEGSIVYNPAELATRVKYIHSQYTQAALVEEFIEGRDINISVLGNGSEVVTLPPAECAYPEGQGTRFLTYATKWLEDSQAYRTAFERCPSVLDPVVEQKMREIAVRSSRIMGCRDYVRVDFRLKGDTPFVLEVNPNPSINPQGSGFIYATEASGCSYTEMINRIIECSLKRRVFNLVEFHRLPGSQA